MKKIIKISSTLRKVFGFLSFIPLPSVMVLWVGSAYPSSPLVEKLFGPVDSSNPYVVSIKELGAAFDSFSFMVFLLLFVILTYWFWQLKTLFGFYAQGKIFTAENAVYVRRTALAFLSITIVSMLINNMLGSAMMVNSIVWYKLLFITVGVLQVCNILIGIVLVVIAWIMDEARHLQEELDSII